MALFKFGRTAQQVGPSTAEYNALTAGALNADLVPATDVSSYRWVSLHVTGTWVGTLTFQGSNDGINWSSVSLSGLGVSSQVPLLVLTANNLVAGSIGYRYLRVRMTAYTSGTATGVMELSTIPGSFNSIGAQVSPNVSAIASGLTSYHLASLATTNAQFVKASAGRVYKWVFSNGSAAAKYVKLYNKASAPTVGTDVPVVTVSLPANGGSSVYSDSVGWSFAAGIAIAITGAAADTDATAVAANDVIVSLEYA